MSVENRAVSVGSKQPTQSGPSIGPRRSSIYRRWFKRPLDIVLVLLGSPFVLPIVLVLMVLVWRDGGRPFYSQLRVGKNGRHYRMWKLRSMVVDAEERLSTHLAENEAARQEWETTQKLRDDPRITPIGQFIRRSSLDELPQLWNVLKGDMSMVGPRPALPRETEQYDAHAWERTSVVPGLTCYWQIQPKRNSLSFEKWLELDLKYIEERSFLVDWKIMFGTISAVLHMEGE